MTFAWLRPPRPERQPAARRIDGEASRDRGVAPQHATELRRELTQLASLLQGHLSEEDAGRATAWLEAHWPWEIAASFERGGYRWLVTGKHGADLVFILLCETTPVRSGSLDVVVVDARGILPNWPRPPKLPRSYVTISTRALPHGIHFWCHLDAAELDADHVARLVSLGAAALEAAKVEPGERATPEISRARICARCSAVSTSRVCTVCDGALCFRVAWGAVQRPRWQQNLVTALLVLYPLLAYGLFKASAFVSPRPSLGSLVPGLLAGLVVLVGLTFYLERARPS
jgi:hypothetical protein